MGARYREPAGDGTVSAGRGGRRPKHPLVRADVLARIEGGTLKPGEVASIAELGPRLGVGRTAARVAMAALEAEGVLCRVPGIGYVVAAPPAR